MTIEQSNLSIMSSDSVFSKQQYFDALKENGYDKTIGSFMVGFQSLVNRGFVQRVGRNAYCVASDRLREYKHEYSILAQDVARVIKQNHPYMSFVVFETVQLNEFINHQIGRNTVFVFSENDVIDFLFDTLKNEYPGKVILTPSIKAFHQYRDDDSIVLVKLVSEAPKDQNVIWAETIEKMLVDIMAERLIRETFSESEYVSIYETAFQKYIIDESKVFRYAKRRNVANKLKDFLKENTNVKLKMEELK